MKNLLLLISALMLSSSALAQQSDKPNPFKPASSGIAAPSAPLPPNLPALPAPPGTEAPTLIVKHLGKVNGVNVYENDQQQFVFSREPLSVTAAPSPQNILPSPAPINATPAKK